MRDPSVFNSIGVDKTPLDIYIMDMCLLTSTLRDAMTARDALIPLKLHRCALECQPEDEVDRKYADDSDNGVEDAIVCSRKLKTQQ